MLISDLLKVEKPARYMGGEMGTIKKTCADLRFILAFPDVYEVGMSHLGLQILYAVLNSADWVAAERVYAPWPDMEELLRRNGTPLATLESGLPLKDADIIGFTLQYELSYTNILNMLELAGIPLLAQERDERFPLLLGVGHAPATPSRWPISSMLFFWATGRRRSWRSPNSIGSGSGRVRPRMRSSKGWQR